MSGLGKKRTERRDYLAHDVSANLSQEDMRLSPFRWRGFAERYMVGASELHVHRMGSHLRRPAHDWCAIFHRAEFGATDPLSVQLGNVEVADDTADRDERWEAVLIKVVEVTKDGQQLRVSSRAAAQPQALPACR